MVEFTFKGLFETTNKGIPDINNLPASTTMTRNYYVCSVIIQCIFFLFFISYFILSIYRVIKKIKNPKFKDVPDEEKREEDQNHKNDKDDRNQQENEDNGETEKDKNLIYRFDEEEEEEQQKKKNQGDHEGEGKEMQKQTLKNDKKDGEDKDETQSNTPEQNYDDYHDVNQQSFLILDEKLLFLQPFLISFIVCNNVFEATPLVLITQVLTLVSYFLFNIKGLLGHIKLLSLLFVALSLVPYLSFFIGDHDVTT